MLEVNIGLFMGEHYSFATPCLPYLGSVVFPSLNASLKYFVPRLYEKELKSVANCSGYH